MDSFDESNKISSQYARMGVFVVPTRAPISRERQPRKSNIINWMFDLFYFKYRFNNLGE